MTNIVTYNCNSIRNNIEIVKCLFDDYDIVLLQEVMLLEEDAHMVKSLHSDWDGIVYVKDELKDGIREGRPSKGVAILWHKNYSQCIQPIYCNERIIGIKLSGCNDSILLINVYLPCEKNDDDSFINYIDCLSMLNVLISEHEDCNVVIMGDFNSRYDCGRFGILLNDFMRQNCISKRDDVLPPDSFTYLSPGHDTTSWIDHVMSSYRFNHSINNVAIRYDISLYDHFPLSCTINFKFNVANKSNSNKTSDQRFIYWNKMSSHELECYRNNIEKALNETYYKDNKVFYCTTYGCTNELHITSLHEYLLKIINVLHDASEEFSVLVNNKKKCVPGWNSMIKPFYENSQRMFLKWKDNGRRREGQDFDEMKRSRAEFKKVFRQCKRNEEQIRNGQMIASLTNKNMPNFWHSVRAVKTNKFINPTLINNKSKNNDIVKEFYKLYKPIFNDEFCKSNYKTNLNDCNAYDIFHMFNSNNIYESVKKLRPSIGPDFIHSFHLQKAPPILMTILSKFFNACILHIFLPNTLTDAIVNPLIKNKQGNIHDTANYRPIFSSSVLLKLFEHVILDQIKCFFKFNDRQHGFRKYYSTTTANIALRETILNYTEKQSFVYACFLDLSKAFDKVCHSILFEKLSEAKIPITIINILKYLHLNQSVKVKFGSDYSEKWYIRNGVRQGVYYPPCFLIYT